MSDLDPAPSALADLLVRMTERDWPTTEEERLGYFASLGLLDIEGARDDERIVGYQHRRLTWRGSGAVTGTASAFLGEFLGIGLFAYDEPAEDGDAAREGYAGVREHLSRRLGAPVEEWGSTREPACLWRPGALMLDLYCFQRLRSGIMVGPAHAARSAALDEAAELPDHSGRSAPDGS